MTNTNFLEYLVSIGISSQGGLGKVKEALELIGRFCPSEVTDIHVNEHVKEDGSREYLSVECFAKEHFACAYLSSPRIQVAAKFHDAVVELRSTNYDYKKASDLSRLSVYVQYFPGGLWEYKGSKENCDHLRDMVRKYLIPSVKR